MGNSDALLIISILTIPLIVAAVIAVAKPRQASYHGATYRPAFKNAEDYQIIRDENGFIINVKTNREVETA